MVKLVHIIVGAAVLVVGYIIVRRMWSRDPRRHDRRKPNIEDYFPVGKYDSTGASPSRCETACFESPYYDACMNSCLQGGHADYAETGDEYDVLGVGQIDDLDRGVGYDTPGGYGPEYGLRGETPGR